MFSSHISIRFWLRWGQDGPFRGIRTYGTEVGESASGLRPCWDAYREAQLWIEAGSVAVFILPLGRFEFDEKERTCSFSSLYPLSGFIIFSERTCMNCPSEYVTSSEGSHQDKEIKHCCVKAFGRESF
mmetsp:Transcript_41301/g.110422  ORF Transcript_41301/g.110422 Transcript_41301/m.110422 type:complete len:128 (+) Transcript_41301:2571-2954(+)